MSNDTNATSGQRFGQSTRRTFLGGLGATAGIGALTELGEARGRNAGALSSASYYVVCSDGRGPNGNGTKGRSGWWNRGSGRDRDEDGAGYLVLEAASGRVAFSTDGTAEAAFQYAFDELDSSGGTVVAGGGDFRFGGPATIGDDTALVGQQGTRLVVAGGEDGATSDEPSGHDLIRARGDDVTIANIEFDANGTQLDNHAIQADGCDGLLVANNRTVDGFQMAISFSRCANAQLVGNEVLDPNWYGITARAADDELDLRRSENVVVARNYVAGVTYNNIATYNVSNFTVYGNVVEDGGHSLIACSPAQQGAIVGNVCRNLEEYAPDPGGEAGIEIEYKETHVREEIADTPLARSFDITISGNQVDNCPVGILARTVPADSDNEAARETERPYSFTVTGNAISDAADAGIRIRSGEAGVVATNTVRNSPAPLEIDETYAVDIQRGLNATRE
ncbi:right-handed parallel beta-helix repeat-containing protein [Haloterrigena sp. SYSU A121-1]|uniref:Right-handed parallel beta-helix repeat-containing protein n=1 Tax=Haloterrigena gelatinilytica TaxID=2741724 RepID=A0A8J8GMU7_9EURY|nr:right-handed parallel beta-helix repeat-containing protein [Haloterrigena gelatinilytica]NUB92058.1 right-handed parallel beta-helix repeat-containing protein [Haloterrigena gelatinilytica]